MSALPLTLDTLQTPGNEILSPQTTALMSPPKLHHDSSTVNCSKAANNDLETPERPSNLQIETTIQHQQKQQHSNVSLTPSAAATTPGTISPALSAAGSLSPSFLPEMPQWKRDLIQRRKQNVQRTISATSPSPTTATAAALSLSSTSSSSCSPTTGVLKISTSSSSVRSLAGSNTNIDQLASDGLLSGHTTKDYTKLTSKLNRQSYITGAATTATNLVKTPPSFSNSKATPSPLKEKAEKLFGGQYTAATTAATAKLTTKEEIINTTTFTTTAATYQQQLNHNKEWCGSQDKQQEIIIMTEENMEEELNEMYRKTKDEQQETELNDETQTLTTAIITNKQQQQQMATRLTGSGYNTTTTNAAASSSTSSSSSTSCSLKRAETERGESTVCVLNNMAGASSGNFVNQSLNKCESERLVCAANTAGNANNNFNTNNNNSVTTAIGGNNQQIINNSSSSHSVSSVNSASSSSVVKISQKLQENQFIKNEQHLNTTKKLLKFKQNPPVSLDLKSPTKTVTSNVLSTSSSATCLSATLATNCALKKKMVAVQEMKKSTQTSGTHLQTISSPCHSTNHRVGKRAGGDAVGVESSDLDASEDLSYGPGIVSKLRCRYLSLALRESMEQQRLNKDQLRRSTSLNNLLDSNEDEENEDEEDDDEEGEQQQELDIEESENYKNMRTEPLPGCKKMGILKTALNNGQEKRFSSSSNTHGSHGVGVTFTETSYNKRSRHLKRGNDSLKRARSVEALLSEKSPWHSRANSSAPVQVTIEDKIHNARERLQQGTDHLPPKRLTSIIDDTERPPPDLVKQTLKMFEASANRRPRCPNRNNSKGEVASKVETFKNIIKEQKPQVAYPKPLSPTKKLVNSPLQQQQRPLKTSTPQANDLMQTPLGRKALNATALNSSSPDCQTPLKGHHHSTTLSEHTPDIIPRQKYNNERDFKPNKELYMMATKEPEVVDSPLTALSKELSKLKLNDATPHKRTQENDNKSSSSAVDDDEAEALKGSGDNNIVAVGDACQRHNNSNNKFPPNSNNNDIINEAIAQQDSGSLKNENPDKIIKNNEETIAMKRNETTPPPPPPKSSNSSSTSELSAGVGVNPVEQEDGDDDDDHDETAEQEYAGLKATKRITRTALDNIAKAGYTQQFKFNNPCSSSPTAANNSNSSSSNNTVKQIGVIRPLPKTSNDSNNSTMETLKHSTNTTTSSLTSREIEKNRINDLKKSSSPPVKAQHNTATAAAAHTSPALAHSSPSASQNLKSPAANASPSAAGFSDVDTVISATNSPLWAMRKRRQAPPAAPAENTTMVFNFSNRKEVPDYIENDGVIFRRKRELPKPNESGFVLLGDLSVETSTDMDYDDFTMCPPSPCDVEFVNANIVIDGKSSIRQKAKDTTFRVQFNDTLTSTFEYPSEASLIVDESFSAYNESYTQPHGSSSSADDFTQAFQNLCLENAATINSSTTTTHHHVADEIIQLPTLNASTPAAANTNTITPTKNILGNLPLDYPDLQKGIPLTTAATVPQLPAGDKKKSRKDLKLPLGPQPQQPLQPIQKPAVPVKRLHLMKPAVAAAGALNSPPELAENCKNCAANQQEPAQPKQPKQEAITARKTPAVLNKPQYACFLQEPTTSSKSSPPVKHPVQRSRSNEFQKTFTTFTASHTVSRSNSLRNLDNRTNNSATTLLLFSNEVNSHDKLSLYPKEALSKPQTPPKVVKDLGKTSHQAEFTPLLNNLTELNPIEVNLLETGCKSPDTLSLQQNFIELSADYIKPNHSNPENLSLNLNPAKGAVMINKAFENINEISENLDNNAKTLTDLKDSLQNSFNFNKISSKSLSLEATTLNGHLRELQHLATPVNHDAANLAALTESTEGNQLALTKFARKSKNLSENETDSVKIQFKQEADRGEICVKVKSLSNSTNSLENLDVKEKSCGGEQKCENLGEESREFLNFANKTDKVTEDEKPIKSLKILTSEEKSLNSISNSWESNDLEAMDKKGSNFYTASLTADVLKALENPQKSLENLCEKEYLLKSAQNSQKCQDLSVTSQESFNFHCGSKKFNHEFLKVSLKPVKSLENLGNSSKYPLKSQKFKDLQVKSQEALDFHCGSEKLNYEFLNISLKPVKSLENLTGKGPPSKSPTISMKYQDLEVTSQENLNFHYRSGKYTDDPIKIIEKSTNSLESLYGKRNPLNSPTNSSQKCKDLEANSQQALTTNCLSQNMGKFVETPSETLENFHIRENSLKSSPYTQKCKDLEQSLEENFSKILENLNETLEKFTEENDEEKSQKPLDTSINSTFKTQLLLDPETEINTNESKENTKPLNNLELENTSAIDLKEPADSNELVCAFVDYTLYRNMATLASSPKTPQLLNSAAKTPDSLMLKSKSVDNIARNCQILTKTGSKSVDNLDLKETLDSVSFTLNPLKDLDSIEYSQDMTVFFVDDTENVLNCQQNLSTSEATKGSVLPNKSANDPAAYCLDTTKINKEESLENNVADPLNLRDLTAANKPSNSVAKKSLHMSLDSLECFDANEETITANLQDGNYEVDFLEDSSQYDFASLLTLKKSKTEYCLQSLDKTSDSSLDSESFESPADTLISAANTLQSKWCSKAKEPHDIKPSQIEAKKPNKTLRVKTTEKLISLSQMAAHNASTYASFRKSKMLYKQASKSFKNSLRFYETFSGKSSSTHSPVKRSLSLPENVLKKSELNRKLFSKTGKIKMKLRNSNEWYSPTENSYSFDYYDAVGDLNGSLGKDHEVTQDLKECHLNQSLDMNEEQFMSLSLENVEQFQEDLVCAENEALDLCAETLWSQKTLNLKSVTQEKDLELYKATTVVDNGETVGTPFSKAFERFSLETPLSLEALESCDQLSNYSETLKGNLPENNATLASSFYDFENSHEMGNNTETLKANSSLQGKKAFLTKNIATLATSLTETTHNSDTLRQNYSLKGNSPFLAENTASLATSYETSHDITNNSETLRANSSLKGRLAKNNATSLKDFKSCQQISNNSETLRSNSSLKGELEFLAENNATLATSSHDLEFCQQINNNSETFLDEHFETSPEISNNSETLRANSSLKGELQFLTENSDTLATSLAGIANSSETLKSNSCLKGTSAETNAALTTSAHDFETSYETLRATSSLKGTSAFLAERKAALAISAHDLETSCETLRVTSTLKGNSAFLAEKNAALATSTPVTAAESSAVDSQSRKTTTVSIFSVNSSKFLNKTANATKSNNVTSTVSTLDTTNASLPTGSQISSPTALPLSSNTNASQNSSNSLKCSHSFSPKSTKNVSAKVEMFSKTNKNSQNLPKYCASSKKRGNLKMFSKNSSSNINIHPEIKADYVNAGKFPEYDSKINNIPLDEGNLGNLEEFSQTKGEIHHYTAATTQNAILETCPSPTIQGFLEDCSKSPNTSPYSQNSSNLPEFLSTKAETSLDFSANSQIFPENSDFHPELPENSSKYPNISPDSLNFSPGLVNLPEFPVTKAETYLINTANTQMYNLAGFSTPNTQEFHDNFSKFSNISPDLGNMRNFPEFPVTKAEIEIDSPATTQIHNLAELPILNNEEFPINSSTIPDISPDQQNFRNFRDFSLINIETYLNSTDNTEISNMADYTTPNTQEFPENFSKIPKIPLNSENLGNFSDFPLTNAKTCLDSTANSQISNLAGFSTPNSQEFLENSSKIPNIPLSLGNFCDFPLTNEEIPADSSTNTQISCYTPQTDQITVRSTALVEQLTFTSFYPKLGRVSSNNFAKFVTNSPARENLTNLDDIRDPKGLNNRDISCASQHPLRFNTNSTKFCCSTPLEEHCTRKTSSANLYSTNSLNFSPTQQQHFKFTPTTNTTTTTLLVKDFNECNKGISTPTTTTTCTTNSSTKVVALYNLNPTNISYTNSSTCSFSSLSTNTTTTNKSFATAKYQANQKASTAPQPLKNLATKTPPKVLPRRLFANASSSTTSYSTCFKASSTTTTTCTSANNNNNNAPPPPPLRRRIPGNTLYYV